MNRVSIGVQSFDKSKLQKLDRDHSPEQIEIAIANVSNHFRNHSIDLIFAAPDETLNIWNTDIQNAIDSAIPHVSTYGLTIEKGTQFWNQALHGQLIEADDDVAATMYETAIDRLVGVGYEHYEVSNFAKPNHRSRHNETYWIGNSYWGFGAGAASYVAGRRNLNHRSTTTYMKRIFQKRSPVWESEQLSAEQSARERLVFGLRRIEGIRIADFEEQTGFSLGQLAGVAIDRFVEANWLELHNNRLRLTRHGLLISDSLWPDLL